MADYQLTSPPNMPGSVIRNSDGATIPPDPDNRDYAEYQQWLADGGVPDPAPVFAPPPPHPAEVALYDHEARLCALEGTTPPTMEEFINTRRGWI
jgi:hypothetical protein